MIRPQWLKTRPPRPADAGAVGGSIEDAPGDKDKHAL